MRILIAEDDFASRKFLYKYLSSFGECDITIDGIEAVDAFIMALEEGNPYDLICLDAMMPKLDGKRALKAIRDVEKQKEIEENKRVKIIMTTALNNSGRLCPSFDTRCEAYTIKPIDEKKFVEVLKKLGLHSSLKE
ncbi:MAG TPA: response regulator [Acetivibrio sp.]|jgi:two-component system chemotaxis response regulator CheY|nr:response regulator [Clostridium sp.]HOQ37993.1 response regulator [Acetivibrio sp.]HPT90318.1 response regulator [Acetivibrio sp.]HQA58140.1 response regulator [Acetivibrio sp.]